MAGRHRNRTGQPKPTCAMETKGLRCTTITAAGWRYCPHHHVIAARNLAAQWLDSPDDQKTELVIRLPDLGRPLNQLEHEEREAFAILAGWQHPELEPS
ncbi:MAG: hypothetical protein H0V45_12925 [Actinobacteria bacterium]|nr:hypothetical protein [Actinomycetota bacterium]